MFSCVPVTPELLGMKPVRSLQNTGYYPDFNIIKMTSLQRIGRRMDEQGT